MNVKEQDIVTLEPKTQRFERMRLLFFATYGFITVVTIIVSLWSVGFDFTKIVWQRFLSDLLINWALTISLMYLASKDGELHFKSSVRSLYPKNLDTLVNRVWAVVKKGLVFAFSGYSHKKYLERLDGYLLKKLRQCGLQDLRILSLSKQDLDTLLSQPNIYTIDGKDVPFDILTPEQFVIVSDLKAGRYTYDELPYEWFLREFTDKDSDQYSYYSRAKLERAKTRRLRLFYRLGMFLLIGAMIASWIVDEDTALSAQSWVNAATRFMTIFMAIVSGYMGAKDDVNDQSNELLFKSTTIDEFFSDYNSGIFVPDNLTDIVRQKLEELERDFVKNDSIQDEDAE